MSRKLLKSYAAHATMFEARKYRKLSAYTIYKDTVIISIESLSLKVPLPEFQLRVF